MLGGNFEEESTSARIAAEIPAVESEKARETVLFLRHEYRRSNSLSEISQIENNRLGEIRRLVDKLIYRVTLMISLIKKKKSLVLPFLFLKYLTSILFTCYEQFPLGN